MKKAIVIYGPPGSGKGTQASLLANKLNLIHFDTGKHLESILYDPANRLDPLIDKFRHDFEKGLLLDPEWVYKIIKERGSQIIASGFGLIFSGSPRTVYEAFEAEGHDRGYVAFLEENFGRDNLHFILLKIRPETSIQRNSQRLICSVCKTAVIFHEHWRPEFCPVCGGLFRRRTDDVPDVIRVRLQEYAERTLPIIDGLKQRGFAVNEIDGEPLPYQVFGEILKKLGMEDKKA